MSNDLVKRLRDAVNGEHDMTPHGADLSLAADRIEELEAKLAKAHTTNVALEKLRPVWAQGWTSDSMAAQAAGNALSKLWELLGAKDQTQAVAALAAKPLPKPTTSAVFCPPSSGASHDR